MIQFIVKGKQEEIPSNFTKLPGHYVAEFEDLNKQEREELKKQFPRGYFRISFWEKGGANFEDGQAQVVCSPEGEKIVPVKIRKKGWLANDRHALFTGVDLCVVTATQVKRNINLVLTRYTIRSKDGFYTEEEIWSGNKDQIAELPDTLKKYVDVLTVAAQKSLEYRCLYPMYYLQKENEEE